MNSAFTSSVFSGKKVTAMENRHVLLFRCMKYVVIKKTFVQKPCRDIAEIYLSIRSSIISFFSLHFKLFPQVSRVQNPELHTKATWNMSKKLALGWSWIQLDSEEATTEVAEVIQRVQLPWRCYSCWCVAAVAVQVSASGCSVECDTPCSWGDAGKIGGDGGNGDGDGAALSSGLSHTAAHSQHEVLFMYGPFMGLKCLHWMNYSLFSQVGKSVHSNSTSIIPQNACI